MALCNSVQAAACLIICGAALSHAQAQNRPAPIATLTETVVVDGGLGTAPPIALPRVESPQASNAAADFSRPFTQTTNANQPNHLAARLLKIGLGGKIAISMPATASGNGKLGFKGLLVHKRVVESAEPTE